MTRSEDIQRSITEADDLEDLREPEIPLAEVLRSLFSHPLQILTRWNWKAAVVGAILRASFYFTVYKASKESWSATMAAVAVEFGFRFFTSGVSGSIVQSFRRATPAWLATLVVTISLPILSHSVEYFTHYVQETYFRSVLEASQNNARQYAFAISVLFSVFSAMFNLFAMRHGVLLVGAGKETKSLWDDFRKIPALVFEFLIYLPKLILRYINDNRIVYAVGVFLAFGLVVGGILGVFRGRWAWAWTTAIGAWAILLIWTLMVAAGMKFLQYRQKN